MGRAQSWLEVGEDSRRHLHLNWTARPASSLSPASTGRGPGASPAGGLSEPLLDPPAATQARKKSALTRHSEKPRSASLKAQPGGPLPTPHGGSGLVRRPCPSPRLTGRPL